MADGEDVNDPAYWRARAAETRKLAETGTFQDWKKDMENAAASFDRLADILETTSTKRRR